MRATSLQLLSNNVSKRRYLCEEDSNGNGNGRVVDCFLTNRRRRRQQLGQLRAQGTTSLACATSSGDDDTGAEKEEKEEEEDPSTAPLIVRDKIKSIILFVIPLMASNVISPLLTMTDTAFVGRYASDAVVALAALGVATPLTDYPVNLFMFVTAGVTSIVSNGLAVREPKRDMERKVYNELKNVE